MEVALLPVAVVLRARVELLAGMVVHQVTSDSPRKLAHITTVVVVVAGMAEVAVEPIRPLVVVRRIQVQHL
jgi:hypothetical protein